MAQLLAAQKSADERGEYVEDVFRYDPAELYAFMCKEYGWRPCDIDEMHFRTFFALVRKTKKRIERENIQIRQQYSQ